MDGERPIAEIAIGDVVPGSNESSAKVGVFVVTAAHRQQHETTLDLTIGGEIVHTTPMGEEDDEREQAHEQAGSPGHPPITDDEIGRDPHGERNSQLARQVGGGREDGAGEQGIHFIALADEVVDVGEVSDVVA